MVRFLVGDYSIQARRLTLKTFPDTTLSRVSRVFVHRGCNSSKNLTLHEYGINLSQDWSKWCVNYFCRILSKTYQKQYRACKVSFLTLRRFSTTVRINFVFIFLPTAIHSGWSSGCDSRRKVGLLTETIHNHLNPTRNCTLPLCGGALQNM